MSRLISIFVFLLLFVGLKSQIVISNLSLTDTTQNIFYIGVDNIIKISGKQFNPLRQSILIQGGGAAMNGVSRTYNIRVQNETDSCQICIYENKKLIFKKNFICRRVGDVIVKYGGVKDSITSISQLLANPFIYIDIPGSYYKHGIYITSFTVTFIGNGYDSLQTSGVENTLTTEQIEIIKKLTRGNRIYFDNIYGFSRDSRKRKLTPFTIKIK